MLVPLTLRHDWAAADPAPVQPIAPVTPIVTASALNAVPRRRILPIFLCPLPRLPGVTARPPDVAQCTSRPEHVGAMRAGGPTHQQCRNRRARRARGHLLTSAIATLLPGEKILQF